MGRRVLVVDDDDDIREAVEQLLGELGYPALSCGSVRQALTALWEEEFDVVITDVRMPSIDGIKLCEYVAETHPDIPVIVMTAYGDVSTIIGAMQATAFDFLRKPFGMQDLAEALKRALDRSPSRREVHRIATDAPDTEVRELFGSSPPMVTLRDRIRRFALSDATVLVTGESGTGKELVARALHRCGPRASGPFVAVNCAALPPGLLASELFGHARGAFTDAAASRSGLFFKANGGTLFLDEIGAMPVELQPTLLRTLEERVARPVGGSEERRFDARIVAATNAPLQNAVKAGLFRQDLLFRLSVLKIDVPPLRERGGDVIELANEFLARLGRASGAEPSRLLPDAAAALRHHQWPGNVRELANAIEAASVFAAEGWIGSTDLPASVRAGARSSPGTAESGEHSLEDVERLHIERVLRSSGYNKAETARLLGIDRTTLYRKMKRLGLERREGA